MEEREAGIYLMELLQMLARRNMAEAGVTLDEEAADAWDRKNQLNSLEPLEPFSIVQNQGPLPEGVLGNRRVPRRVSEARNVGPGATRHNARLDLRGRKQARGEGIYRRFGQAPPKGQSGSGAVGGQGGY